MRNDEPTWHGPDNAEHAVIFSTGDEGRASDPVPSTVVAGLVAQGIRVLCLPCIGGALETRDERLAARLLDIPLPQQPLVLAGSSRGARVSAGLVERLGAVGLVAFAYPFHARTDPNPRGRERELARLPVPVLLVQGTRDSHGNRQQVTGYGLPSNVDVHWMDDANHALVPRASSGHTQAGQLEAAVTRMVAFIRSL